MNSAKCTAEDVFCAFSGTKKRKCKYRINIIIKLK